MTIKEKLDAMLHLPMPEGLMSMPSGPVCFSGDWPGYFLRGDEAANLARLPETLERLLESCPDVRFSEKAQVLSLVRHLGDMRRCVLSNDEEVAGE